MATVTVIDPLTRLEGHLKIKVAVDTVNGVQQVVEAWATGTMFRGFESILINRHPTDAQHITQRICGVCPVSHGMAAVMALDQAYGLTVPDNARIMRNLVLGANLVDSHILHFYHLALPDFINGLNMPPWQPSWQIDKRFSPEQNNTGGPLRHCPGHAAPGPGNGGHFWRSAASYPHFHPRGDHHHAHQRHDYQI
jgi:hydrogenase large subunit